MQTKPGELGEPNRARSTPEPSQTGAEGRGSLRSREGPLPLIVLNKTPGAK